jgi:AAA+ superfamily predicted ATPase
VTTRLTESPECIANFLERPLMVLTTTDIGTRPEDVEENLTRNFKVAKNWNAVLLMDEADGCVANRTIKDLHRSSLVASMLSHLSKIEICRLASKPARVSLANCRSGFLHALEFYDGILFLTTNRVGAFDDAIMSRVHIQMFYPNLNAEERHTVWNTFIHKLEAEKPSMQVKYAVKEYLRSGEMKDFEMNGREIRNGENII